MNVIIICTIHGEFLQSPDVHKRGVGCPKCSGRGLSTKEIIQEFKKVHNDRYDYSKVDYINGKIPVVIICPEHGEFSQRSDTHKQGAGCPRCGGSFKVTQEEAIEEFRKVHVDKYDYSKVRYVNASNPISIICPEHGEFQQIPSP